MDDLNNNNVPSDGPLQQPVGIQPDADTVNVLASSSGNNNNQQVTQPIGEQNHAEEIAMNRQQMDNTYSYNSQAEDKSLNEKPTTTTALSNGSMPISTEWDSQNKMDTKYTANDSEDYSWNKLAKEQAQNYYKQEEGQARYESIQAKQELDQAMTSAFNNYFSAKYAARQTQDKMGWTGGQQQASDLQIEFLQAEQAANMYTQNEMQKYGLETKLETARLYADSQQRSLALQYYQDARDQAISEAELTGYYIEPEAAEMMVQMQMANEVANNPGATQAEKDRAASITANAEAYFKDLGFEYGTRVDKNGKIITELRGVKTLATLQYEETVRNNKVQEELQKQANKIAEKQANAAWAGVNLQKKQFKVGVNTANITYMNQALKNGEDPSKIAKQMGGSYNASTDIITVKNAAGTFTYPLADYR